LQNYAFLSAGAAEDVIQSRFGYPLTLLLLLGVAVYNVVELISQNRRSPAPPQPYGHSRQPGDPAQYDYPQQLGYQEQPGYQQPQQYGDQQQFGYPPQYGSPPDGYGPPRPPDADR
jgi:hypothetical protein